MIVVSRADIASAEAKNLLAQLSDTLKQITGNGGRASFNVTDVQQQGGCFAIAHNQQGEPVGCGALRPLVDRPDVAELKRFFACPGTKGVGVALLHFLEQEARQMGYREIWLETRRVNLRALYFYQRNGYRIRENFGRYVGVEGAVCLGRLLYNGA